jgi:hypothetical protein
MGFQNNFGHKERIGFAILKNISPATFINSVTASGGVSMNTTVPTDTTGSKLFVIAISSYKLGTTVIVNDSNANVYIPLPVYDGAAVVRCTLFYCINPITSTNTTFTAISGTGYPGIMVSFYGGGTFTYQSENGNTGGSVTSLPVNPVPIITSSNLTISVINYFLGSTPTSITSGFNITNTIPRTGTTLAGAACYKINSILPNENPIWSWTNLSGETSAAIANFSYI